MTPTASKTDAPLLSVVIITRNEAHNLPRLLQSVQGIADEIVVFDSGSTDGTVRLAQAAGARVEPCEWKGWSATKNAANGAANGRWILSLDADEALTEESRQALLHHIAGPSQDHRGAWRVGEINRLTRYCGRWVRHSGWFPDRKLRLWPKGAAQWQGTIHEDLSFGEHPISVTRLGVVEHHSYPHPADHLAQIERFGKVWAEDQHRQNKRYSMALVWTKVAAQWIKTFLIKRGFLDGTTGWTVARRSAWATWRKHARLRALHSPDPVAPERILIARTDALGDLVVTLPLIGALKKRFPEAQVDLLVRPYAEAIAECAREGDRVVLWDKGMASDPRSAGAMTLQKGRYDAIVFAFPDPSVVRAAKVAGIPIRVATGRRWSTAWKVTHRIWDSRHQSGGHEAWHGLRLLRPLGVDAEGIGLSSPTLEPPAADETVETLLKPMGGSPVLIHPGSNGSAGNWSASGFAELANMLTRRGLVVAMTGTKEEGEAFAPFLQKAPEVHNLCGTLNLTQLLALQARSLVTVASSTGPLHTAASMGKPVVGLYHTAPPAWPERWAPLGPFVEVLSTDALTGEGHLQLDAEVVLQAVLRVIKLPSEGV